MKVKCSFMLVLALLPLTLLFSCRLIAQEEKVNSSAENISSELDEYFSSIMASQKYAGLGACLIKGDKILWQGSYGFSDRETHRKVKDDDIFLLCSLSKTVTTAALMLLYEKGLFKLDDDINSYMPLQVRNPNFPNKPVTFRMLLTHTGGFSDLNPAGLKHSYGVTGDSEIPLSEFTEELFTPGSRFYSIDNFSLNEPGSKYEYSNISFALIGYLVEKLSNEDFAGFCNKNIFTPLEMKNTAWHIRDLDTGRFVYHYTLLTEEPPVYKKVRHYSEHDYSAGCLRTTISDFSKFISVLMNEGRYKNIQIFKPETVSLMLSPQGIMNILSRSHKVLDIALTWLIIDLKGEDFHMMNGFSGNMFTNACFSVKNKTALLFFVTGISMKNMQATSGITNKLKESMDQAE